VVVPELHEVSAIAVLLADDAWADVPRTRVARRPGLRPRPPLSGPRPRAVVFLSSAPARDSSDRDPLRLLPLRTREFPLQEPFACERRRLPSAGRVRVSAVD